MVWVSSVVAGVRIGWRLRDLRLRQIREELDEGLEVAGQAVQGVLPADFQVRVAGGELSRPLVGLEGRLEELPLDREGALVPEAHAQVGGRRDRASREGRNT